MPTLYFKFALKTHTGTKPPALAVAVDLDGDHSGDPNEFADMRRKDLTWEGTLSFSKPTKAEGLTVLWAFNATPGTPFKYEVYEDSADGKLLFTKNSKVAERRDIRVIVL